MTDRQEQIIEFIKMYKNKNGYSPSIREIAAAVGCTSSGTVHRQLQKLSELNKITFVSKIPRSINLID